MASSHGKIAKKYARALFELCQPADFEPREKALKQISEDLKSSPEFSSALKNPAIPPARREVMVRDLCTLAKPGDQIFSNFVATMLVNNRIDALDSTTAIFARLAQQFMKVLSLEVTSAFVLSNEEKSALQSDIQKLVPQQYASHVSITWHEDKSLIGGMVVKAGDRVLDGSLAGALERVGRAVA